MKPLLFEPRTEIDDEIAARETPLESPAGPPSRKPKTEFIRPEIIWQGSVFTDPPIGGSFHT